MYKSKRANKQAAKLESGSMRVTSKRKRVAPKGKERREA